MRTRPSRPLPSLVAALAILVPLALADVARAQEVSAADHAEAVTRFQGGRRFVEQNNCKEAISRFVESLRFEQSVGARFNLAECSEKEQRIVDAWNQYKGAEQLAIQKNDRERAEQAHTKGAALEPKVLKVRLVLPENIAFTVKIDGKVIERPDHGLLKTGYAVEPGQAHAIEVSAPNRQTWTKTDVQGAAGAELPAMVVNLGGPLEPEGTNVGAGQRRLGLVVGGVGVVGIVVGAVAGVIAINKRSTYQSTLSDDGCTGSSGTRQCNSTFQSDIDSKKSAFQSSALVSTIGFIAGGVLVAGGAVLYFTAPKAASTSAARLHLVPAIGPGTAGAFLGGTF